MRLDLLDKLSPEGREQVILLEGKLRELREDIDMSFLVVEGELF